MKTIRGMRVATNLSWLNMYKAYLIVEMEMMYRAGGAGGGVYIMLFLLFFVLVSLSKAYPQENSLLFSTVICGHCHTIVCSLIFPLPITLSIEHGNAWVWFACCDLLWLRLCDWIENAGQDMMQRMEGWHYAEWNTKCNSKELHPSVL